MPALSWEVTAEDPTPPAAAMWQTLPGAAAADHTRPSAAAAPTAAMNIQMKSRKR